MRTTSIIVFIVDVQQFLTFEGVVWEKYKKHFSFFSGWQTFWRDTTRCVDRRSMTQLREGSAACKHLQQKYLLFYSPTHCANLRDKGGMCYVPVIIPTRVPSNPVATHTTSYSLETWFSMEFGTPIATKYFTRFIFVLPRKDRASWFLCYFLIDGGTLFS